MDSVEVVRRIVLNLVPMVLSLSVHEFAHATVADRLGDDTPRRQGRLTLSPLAHYDIWGTILIPIAAAFQGGFSFIGWARPVEFVPTNLTRKVSMRTGSILVAAAGPISNFVLALVSVAALAALVRLAPEAVALHDGVGGLAYFLRAMFVVNVGLCVFNFLPLPPLDGSRLLPRSLDEVQEAIAPYSFVIILVLLNVQSTRHALFEVPVGAVSGVLEGLFGLRGLV